MQIKVIKKGENNTQKNQSGAFRNAVNIKRKIERKVEDNIMNWVSDLREKKNLEFARTQVLLSSLR